MASGARGIQSIEIGGRILTALADSNEAMMLRDIALAAELAPAQCHAYLTSLRRVGLVDQESPSGRYCMGPFAMHLGIGWLRSSPLPATAIAALKKLSDETGILSLIAVWGRGGPTIVHINEGAATAALNLRQGTLYSVTGTATGRVFAAFLDPAITKAWIESELTGSRTRKTLGHILTRPEFAAALQATKKLGYSIANEVPIPGINAISVPVFDSNGHFELVASLVGPVKMLPVDADSAAIHRLLQTARGITRAVAGVDSAVEPA